MTPPVTFTDKLAAARSQSGIGYPYQIRAEDLDRNFYFATLQLDASAYESTTSGKGYEQRRLRLQGGQSEGDLAYWSGTDWVPLSPPSGGLHVLASSGGTPFWLETEACE
jgi:hypothetical protein